MPKAVPYHDGTAWAVFCPACRSSHVFRSNVWTFNGDAERPTFSPSMLEKSGHYAGRHQPGDSCWCTYRDEHGKPAPFKCYVCHSFVRDGRIEFLGDCTHEMANQTVDLPDFPSGA